MARILIAGGYGVVGGWMARLLREAGHDFELVLGGRKPEAGARIAAELDAQVVAFDLDDAAASLAAAGPVDLVMSALHDADDELIMASLRAGASYLGIVRKCDTLGPAAMAASILAERPVLIAGHWQAGTMSAAARAAAQAFGKVERIELGALYDPEDPAGPMSQSDAGAFFTPALMRRDGAWVQVAQAENIREVRRDGLPHFQAQPMGVLDVAGLEAATHARDIRFDIGIGMSIGRAAGAAPSHDIHIDLWGADRDGRPLATRTLLSDPKGQAHLTALGAVIGAERLLGLDGQAPPPAGLQFPERVIDAERAVERMRAFGVRIEGQAMPADGVGGA